MHILRNTTKVIPSGIGKYSRVESDREFAGIRFGVFECILKVFHVSHTHPGDADNYHNNESRDFSEHEKVLHFRRRLDVVAIDEC